MRELIESLASGEGFAGAAVLHLGAGGCRELELYKGARKVMLVEALPETARALQAEVRGNADVEVVAFAVAPAQGPARLRVLNNPRESSLLAPSRLLERMPNLRLEREVSVRAMTLVQLVQRLAPPEGARNLLVMELQGLEVAVLRTAAPQLLQKFACIAVRCSSEALFEEGASVGELDAVLHEAGFRLAPGAPNELAWPYQHALYRSDQRSARLEASETELAELKRRAEADAGELRALAAQVEEMKAEQARLAQAERELGDAVKNAALSTKLLTLREADLRELQERYGAALSAQERQRELLARLSERLGAAAGYFRELAASQAALEAPRVRAKSRRARSKTP